MIVACPSTSGAATPPDQRRPRSTAVATRLQPTRRLTAAHGGQSRGIGVGLGMLVTATERAWWSPTDRPVVSLITRRSQVQILSPPPKRPGQNMFLAWSCRVRATTLQPTATRPRRRGGRSVVHDWGGVDRHDPPVTTSGRRAEVAAWTAGSFEHPARRSPGGSTTGEAWNDLAAWDCQIRGVTGLAWNAGRLLLGGKVTSRWTSAGWWPWRRGRRSPGCR